MSINPLNEISAVYMQEVLKPQLGKNIAKEKPPAGGGEKKEGDASDGSAKRIRQAVYDIRYRARREEIPVQQAYGQYMSHTTMTGPEKSEVKSKLGEEKVTEEVEEKKFQVRVTDKNSGKSYVRMATREKINQLRSNSNISSVEMTKYGTPYEGEKKKGKQTASVTSGKGLDPVGHEDKDIDNDGDHDKNDKYLLNRRKVRGAAIGKRVTKENFSNWREDLYEIVDKIEKEKSDKKIVEKNISNKINVHPKMNEAIEAIGGQLIEMVEIDEVIRNPESRKKLRAIMDTDKGRKGDASKGENPRSKYPSERSKQALHLLLHGSGETGSKGNPVRSRGGTNAPADERVGKGPNRAANAKYWAGNAGPTRDRGSGNKAARRAAELSKEEFEIEEGMTIKDFKANRRNIKRREASVDAKSRGHVSKNIVTHGKTYGTDEAKSGRANMSDYERSARKSFAMNPDQVGDTRETSDKTKNQNKLRKQKAMGEFGESAVPGKPAERLGAVTAIPKSDQDAARERTLAKAAAIRAKKLNKEEVELDEKTLTSAETKKREEIVKSMKKSAGDFEKRYPGRGKEVMYATATKQAKRVAEAVGQMPGRETTPPSGTTAKQDDIQKRQVTNAAEKQKLANLKTMQQKQQMLQRQKLNLQKQGKLPLNAEEVEHIDELNRYEKETGKDYKTGKSVTKGGTMGGNDSNSKVMRHMHKVMGAGKMGAGGPIQPRGKGKVPGQKPPTAGEYGSERRSPEQIVKNRRIARQQGRDNMSSRFD